jgi:hypothetical protein
MARDDAVAWSTGEHDPETNVPGLCVEVCRHRPSTHLAEERRRGYPPHRGATMYQRIELSVRQHEVVLSSRDGRWTATVDGIGVEGWYGSSADAWTAAVGEVERFEGLAAAARVMHR